MAEPALLLLPGLLCDRDSWAAQIEALGARCIVAEYGASDSIPAMARLALAAAPSRVIVAGHSMGGRVALEVVRQAPGRVAALALIDTGYQGLPAGESGEAERRARQRLLERARTEGMPAMAREWVRNMVHPDRLADRELIDRIVAMFGRRSPAIHAAQIRALLERPAEDDLLPAIRCPVGVICGRQDAFSPLERHEFMAQRIPGARLHVIEDAGHMSPMERPEAVTAALRAVIASAATIPGTA